MKIVKRLAKKPIVSKTTGKEFTPMNYFIKTENNQYILIKPVFSEDYKRLEMICDYEK